ncbi:hypothetical protein VB264_15210 [Arcicella aquatica]|uniref:Uncharacterized protein n=1 Tax=Arcicella aquatica TaxID=217141 RepID=A0ABU5QR38_9BACT|nr:hypothetical protein [Arcicella aquatica]MEA5259144.1 hypothetical protein [Arcicella aquatica]
MTTKLIIAERLIRKAWFVVLRHLKEQPAFYKEACKELGISYHDEIFKSGIEILDISNCQLIFNDDIENNWHQNGSIRIDFLAKILHGYEAKICAIINNKVLKGRIKHSVATHNSEKLSKGGIAQTVFNIGATNWQQNSNQITINESLLKELNPKKILMLYEYVKVISIFYGKKGSELEIEMDFLQKELSKLLSFQNQLFEFKQDIGGAQSHYKVWSNTNNFPQSLFNTKWLRYERRDFANLGPDSIKSTRGFSIGCIEFIGGKKKFPTIETCINLDINNTIIKSTLKGICRFEHNSNYLFIDMNNVNITDDSINNLDLTSLYVLRMNKIDIQNQEIIIGYHIFYSLIKHKYLVKTTLFVKFSDEQALPFTPRIINSSESDYKNIPILIRRFFANRSMNRLTIPSSVISHLEKTTDNSGTLHDFLLRQGKIIDDTILGGIIGNFDLFYYHKKTYPTNDMKYLDGIRKDKLIIDYDDDLCELRATFIHKNKEIYKGKGFRKNRTIQFLLEQTNSPNNLVKKIYRNGDNDRKVVYFAFPVPSYDEVFFEDEIKNNLSFEGVLSGIDDEKALPLSFSALLVKEDISLDLSNPNDKMTKKLLFHFKKLSATYLATENIFNHFSD